MGGGGSGRAAFKSRIGIQIHLSRQFPLSLSSIVGGICECVSVIATCDKYDKNGKVISLAHNTNYMKNSFSYLLDMGWEIGWKVSCL